MKVVEVIKGFNDFHFYMDLLVFECSDYDLIVINYLPLQRNEEIFLQRRNIGWRFTVI